MPTSDTPAKSKPLVIICVPTRISVRRASKSAMMALNAFSEVTLSRSKRATRASGKIREISSSTFSVPKPIGSTSVTLHEGHFAGTSSVWPQ